MKTSEERIGADRHTCRCGRSWPTRYGELCHECGRDANGTSDPVSIRLNRYLKPLTPDDGPDDELLEAPAPDSAPVPIAAQLPVPELVTVERWCPTDECSMESWRGAPDSVCFRCRRPGVDQDEATLEQRRRIVAELVKDQLVT